MAEDRKEPYRYSQAWFQKQSDEQLHRLLEGGQIGNRDVDGALAELNRRGGDRVEKLTRRTYYAALAALVVSAIGVGATLWAGG